MEFQIRCLTLFFLFSVIDGQEYPVNPGVPQDFNFGLTFSLLQINDLPDDVICNVAICADDTTLYSKSVASDLWQQLELGPELESDLGDTVDCSKKWLIDFNARKTQLVVFD